jgi:hypothetical protein
MKRLRDKSPETECGHDGRKYARSPTGPIVARNGVDRKTYDNLTCYGCDAPLSYRTDHTRARNGVEFNVDACFTHVSDGNTGCSAGETYYHRVAKDVVIHTPTLQFTTQCLACKKTFPVHARKNAVRATAEWKWQNFVLDVAFLSEDDSLMGAVEVCYTHEMSEEKRDALSKSGVAWVEVSALSVLDSMLVTAGKDVSVMSCAMAKSRCWECVLKCNKEEDAMRDALRRRAEKRADATRGAVILTFGKHSGLPLETVWKSNPQYIRWLSGFTGRREGNKPIIEIRPTCIPPHVIAASLEKVKKHCLLCFSVLVTKDKWRRWCVPCYHDAEGDEKEEEEL